VIVNFLIVLFAAVCHSKSFSEVASEKIVDRHDLVQHLLESLYMKLPSAHTTQDDLLAHPDLIQGEVEEDGIHYFDKSLQPSMLNSHKTYLSGITYGEVGAQQMFDITQTVLQACNVSAADGEFWDIGSGDGKVAIQQYLERDFTRVVGVELVRRRFDIAVDALKELETAIKAETNNTVTQFLRKRFGTEQPVVFEGTWSGTNMTSYCLGEADSYKRDGRQICFIHGDATALNVDGASGVEEAVMVYTASQCFAENVMTTLTDRLFRTMLQGAVVSLKELPKIHATSAGMIDVDTVFRKVYAHSKEEQPVYIYKNLANDGSPHNGSLVEKQ
jgi:hypothetical protein